MSSRKGINVKVKTTKVIDALQKVLAERIKLHDQYLKDEKAYKLATENAEKKVMALIKAGKATVTEVSENNRWRNDSEAGSHKFSATVLIKESDLGVKAEAPKDPHETNRANDYTDYATGNRDIENAIRILKMTDEEYVSTSTYSAVSRYL